MTPLLYSIIEDDLSTFNFLFNSKDLVKQSCKDNYNNTICHYAAKFNTPDILKEILLKTKEFINDVNVFNQTPLIVAAKNGFDEVFNILINIEGIQINKQDINGINFIVFIKLLSLMQY